MFIYLGYDGISLLFLFLTSAIIPLCILFNWNNKRDYINEYLISLVCIELLLFLVFTVTNILMFYIFFELILIPFFIMIGFYGSRARKVHASYLLFFYTLFGSVLMLISILFLYIHSGSTNFYILCGTEFSSMRESFL